MAEPVIRWKCKHCKKTFKSKSGATRHEKVCYHNPRGLNCLKCKKSYRQEDGSCYCSAMKAQIVMNVANKCSQFKRSKDDYRYRYLDGKKVKTVGSK